MQNKSVISKKSATAKSQGRKSVLNGPNKENIAEEDDKNYSYDQPSELINPEELRNLTAVEKKIFHKRCEIEMFEY